MIFKRRTRPHTLYIEDLLAKHKPAPMRPPEMVIVRENEYRPCWVEGRKALFHRWVNSARPQLPRGQKPDENARYFQFRETRAMVEYEDGTVDLVWPRDITFCDRDKFLERWERDTTEE